MSGGQHAHRKVSFCNSAELICTDRAENLVLYESSVPVPETDERSAGGRRCPKMPTCLLKGPKRRPQRQREKRRGQTRRRAIAKNDPELCWRLCRTHGRIQAVIRL
ncbi:hypothetical protein BOX15_Mlig013150g1 [Macrostomum lignano]|uniref:Uncharacterized protein n=1 Tax=Macrostomum lignano TaxID=282301 RepID=A0A267F4N1_9PLAT|nr:hypothetical protein BOX15_Mlig013150g1 [Macrostomum lignano]